MHYARGYLFLWFKDGHEFRKNPSQTLVNLQYMLHPPPPTSKYHPVSLYDWPFLRQWQFFIFPLATILNFNLFLKKFKIETSKFQKATLWIVTGNSHSKKFGKKRIKSVGVAFWNFHSHMLTKKTFVTIQQEAQGPWRSARSLAS